jgi:hypothetical protein
MTEDTKPIIKSWTPITLSYNMYQLLFFTTFTLALLISFISLTGGMDAHEINITKKC